MKPLTPALLAEAIERTETVANPDELLQDEKLLLGIKTFGAGHNTWDKKSRFVSLVTVLEILKTQTDRPAFSQEVIKKFLELLSTFHPNGENEKQQREQLERDLVHMKKQSISSEICDLAFNSRSSTTIQPGSREESDKVVKRIYDIRSKLVHTGKVPPKAGIGSDQRLAEGFETVRIVSAEALQSLIEKHLK